MWQRCSAVEATRQPLVRRPSAAAAPRMYNPRFEEDYAAGKDYDPDRSVTIVSLRMSVYIARIMAVGCGRWQACHCT